MPLSLTCPPCGQILIADDEDDLIVLTQSHVRDQHGTLVPADEVLEHAILVA